MTAIVGVDADMIVYRAASAAQHVWYNIYPQDKPEEEQFLLERCESSKAMKAFIKKLGKTPEDFNVVKDLEIKEWFQAKLITDAMIEKIYKNTGAHQAIFLLSDATCFRHRLAKTRTYKDRPKDKPHYYQDVKDYLRDKYNAITAPDLEADDAIGILAEYCAIHSEPFIMASGDKDLNQIPGMHYDFLKEKLYHVNTKDSLKFFFTQVLMGDSTDTIPGLPGMGAVKAGRVLEDCRTLKEMEDATRDAYINHTVGSKAKKTLRNYFENSQEALEYLNEQANLVYIRRQYNQGVKL